LKNLQNFVRKYSLIVELLVIKYGQQNISVAVTLISAVTGPEVTSADRTTLLPVHLLTSETPDFNAQTPKVRDILVK